MDRTDVGKPARNGQASLPQLDEQGSHPPRPTLGYGAQPPVRI